MSLPLRIYYCSKCKFEQSDIGLGHIYVYKFNDGTKIKVPTMQGWCFNCNKIERIQKGISPSILKSEIERLDNKLKKIKKRLFIPFSIFEKSEITKIKEEIELKQKYLQLIGDRTSINCCIQCGSINVFPIELSPDSTPIPETTTFTHINCGGNIKMRYEDIRFNIKCTEAELFPRFLSNDNQKSINKEHLVTTDDIPNYSFISDAIIKIIDYERNILLTQKDKLFGFKNEIINEASFHRHFMIERFLFFYSIIKYERIHLDLELMKDYIAAVATKVYKITINQAYEFIDDRIDFYINELDMLNKLEHPHPGKIVWSLYNPSCNKLNHQTDESFESNIIAGAYLIQNILGVFNEEVIQYTNIRN